MDGPQPSNEERLMAFFSHASVVIFGPGMLVGFFIWITQKDTSKYASRQGLQAAMYQLIGMIVVTALWFGWGIFYALTFIPLIQSPEQYQEAPPEIFWIGLGSMIVPLFVMTIWILYGLWAALQSVRGRDFSYIFIGKLPLLN
jgi:uncharacterized Tic20 family protein